MDSGPEDGKGSLTLEQSRRRVDRFGASLDHQFR